MLCIMVGSVPMLILFAGRNQLSGKIHDHVMTRKRFIYHRPGLIWGESTHNGQGCGGLIFPCCWPEQVVDYNKVSVTVAMVISTMHEKSCIDSHNAREFEKKSPNPVIHNDKTAEASYLWIYQVISTIRSNNSESYYLQNWAEFVFELSLIPLKTIDA